ncbi:MAG: hypothetical protein IJS62_04960 [Bacteroidales bacterium]|nr:hypothetical protein [Bacteroidales bacterium]
MSWIDLRKYPKAVAGFVFFVFLHSLRYFDFVGLSSTLHGRVTNVMALLLILICIFSRSPRYVPGRYWMLALLLIPMLSFLPAWIENGQSPVESMRAYLCFFLVLVYFLPHKAKLSTEVVLNALTVFALARTFIYVAQQFTYPDYWFAFRQDGLDMVSGTYKDVEVRSGIYRFYIEDTYLSMFLVFRYFQELTQRFSGKALILFMVGLLGVYLDQSRQFMASTLVALSFVFLFSSHSKRRWLVLVGLVAFAVLIVLNSSKLFGELMDLTAGDLSDDNIRLITYATYGLEFWGGPLSVLFGNGPIGNSAYGEQVRYFYDTLHLYHADVGIVGAANMFGVLTALCFISFYIFFVVKNWKKLQMHLKMYFVAFLVNAPLVTIYTQNINWFVFFGFMLFLADRDIVRYERKLAS